MSDSDVPAILFERGALRSNVLLGRESRTGSDWLENRYVAGIGAITGWSVPSKDPYSIFGKHAYVVGVFLSTQTEALEPQQLSEWGRQGEGKVPTLESLTQRRFELLAEQWRSDTGHYSILARRYSHQAYRSILEMGTRVVPFILRELTLRPDRWFEALSILTGENPARGASTFDEAVQAWLRWGRERDLLH